MGIHELLLGRPFRSEEEEAQKIGPLRGIPILGLDALASAAYGPEAALTMLMPVGLAATGYIGPISAVIVAVLVIVCISYRQTIAAYPNGGGSYTVASANLGPLAGLLAASALSLDYILNVAVAVSAGVGAIVSALPALLPYTLDLCLAILVLLTIVNLRGVREAGLVFMLPTYAFLGCLGLIVVLGIAKTLLAHGHPIPLVRPPAPGRAVEAVGAWLLLRAFASGCTAMTGVEAVSNGVPVFKEPTVKMAQRTLTAVITALVLLLTGIAYLSYAYGIAATPAGQPGYESVLSQLIAAVAGRGVFYYGTVASVVTVLCLSANTSFADFPRLCRVLAMDEYLPAGFAHPGRRLVYSAGIVVLAICSGLLLIAFGGITDRLIPLFAIGAFLAFTMSQAGMVAHWTKTGGRHAARSRVINGIGGLATGATLLVVVASKFTEGAWITLLVIPAVLLLFLRLRRNRERVERGTDAEGPLQLDHRPPPIVIVPIKRLSRVARKALRLAISMSPDVEVVQIFSEDLDMEDLRARWRELVEQPARRAGLRCPRLVLLKSPYREFFGPLLSHVRKLTRANPARYVAVVVPELVERRWYHYLLQSHRSAFLTGLLLLRGGPRVIVISTPWYLRDDEGATHG
jgi:amino acid transporter